MKIKKGKNYFANLFHCLFTATYSIMYSKKIIINKKFKVDKITLTFVKDSRTGKLFKKTAKIIVTMFFPWITGIVIIVIVVICNDS